MALDRIVKGATSVNPCAGSARSVELHGMPDAFFGFCDSAVRSVFASKWPYAGPRCTSTTGWGAIVEISMRYGGSFLQGSCVGLHVLFRRFSS